VFARYDQDGQNGVENIRDSTRWNDDESACCLALSPFAAGKVGPGDRFMCTLQFGHIGSHLGGGLTPGRVWAEWDDDRATDPAAIRV
jgi:hypothetical protein